MTSKQPIRAVGALILGLSTPKSTVKLWGFGVADQEVKSRDQSASAEMRARMRAASEDRPPVPRYDPYFPLPPPQSSATAQTKSYVPFRIYEPTRG